MGLFAKKEHRDEMPLYSVGLQKTLIIVGLGNVGKEYAATRHNVGFFSIDAFAESNDFPAWIEKKDLKCQLTSHILGDTRIILVKPTTMMNLSGEAVQQVLNFYKIPLSRLIAVHDELDIPFGQIRTRIGGSSAGNNGIKSIIQHCGEEFGRIRIGIWNEIAEKADSANFVLGKFSKEEQEALKPLTHEINSILIETIFRGELVAETRSFLV
jgi:PTH1 family peptidyl-tRNA hydrolase